MAAGGQLTITFIPGTTWAESDTVTAAKLNLGDAAGQWTVTGQMSNLTNVSNTAPQDGYMLVYVSATGLWTPQPIPASTSDTFNRVFAWAHYT